MKTIKILNSYVRISAIESINVHPKISENGWAHVNVVTKMLHFNLSFKTDEEAEAEARRIADIVNEQK